MSGPSPMRLPPLVPTGSARTQFLGASAATADGAEPLPAELAALFAAHDVADGDLAAAWEVARWAAPAPLEARRALACLVVALLDAEAAGGTLLPLSDAAALARRLARLGLPRNALPEVAELAAALLDGTAPAAIAALVGPPGARRPFILADGGLQADRLWALEDELAGALRRRIGGAAADLAPGDAVDAALAAAEAVPGAGPLSDEQRVAVRAALTRPLSLVAGAPGTGKTSIVVAILRVLVRLGVPAERIALAAPTGRAAQRMKESVDAALARLTAPDAADTALRASGPAATTLHRLIGIRPARDRVLEPDSPVYHAGWRLPQRVILVDEASMIDLALMHQLAAAVADDAHLVLLGDAEQLPSVESGAVFRDLLAGAPASAFRLIRSHRMNPERPEGAEILRVAMSIKDGQASTLPGPTAADRLRFAGVEALGGSELGAFLDRWLGEILGSERQLAEAVDRRQLVGPDGTVADAAAAGRVAELLAIHARARILCLTRTAGRRTSAQAVNQAMHGRLQTAALGRGVSPSLATGPFIPGEPVILLANDHGRGLFNGDVGVVLRIHGSERGERLGVAFARGESTLIYRLDELAAHLGLAFALTVHKAQGSEYERVALVLPETDVPLLSREIVYTALTRARTSVTVIGDPALLSLAAGRPLDRLSNLAAKVAAPGQR